MNKAFTVKLPYHNVPCHYHSYRLLLTHTVKQVPVSSDHSCLDLGHTNSLSSFLGLMVTEQKLASTQLLGTPSETYHKSIARLTNNEQIRLKMTTTFKMFFFELALVNTLLDEPLLT
jgi:hypothetical protein